MSTDPPLLIELLGQPGAGKTTLARAVGANSAFRSRADLGTAWRRLSIARKGLFLATAVLDGACWGRAMQLVVRVPLIRADSLYRLVSMVAKSHWIRSQSGQLLLAEGCLQDLWSIFYSARKMKPDPGLLAPLIHCLYRSMNAKIVYIEVNPQTATDRIRSRQDGRSRLDLLPEPDLRIRLIDAEELPLRLAEAARLAGLHVEIVDGSLPMEGSAEQLRAIVLGRA